ncbi:MAG: hypothetical protein ACRDMW_06430 [Gaiellaceae bacterium]
MDTPAAVEEARRGHPANGSGELQPRRRHPRPRGKEGDQGGRRGRAPARQLGIVALFEERWVEDVEKALAKADKTTAHEVDSDSADEVKATATS